MGLKGQFFEFAKRPRILVNTGLLALGVSAASPVQAQAPPVQPQAQAKAQAYWVFFTDKGPIADLRSSLEARALELSAATLRRRAKVRPTRALVDQRDLAVSQDYSEQVVRIANTELRTRSRWLNALSIPLTPAQRSEVEALPFVDRVEAVGRSRRPEIPAAQIRGPWAPTPELIGPPRAIDYGKTKAQLERMGIPKAHECGLTGKGITVGVLDSGFRTKLGLFKHIEIVGQYDFVKKDDNVSNQPGDASGQDGHGTSCLGLLAGSKPGEYVGAAPDVKVLLAKTEDTGSEKPIEEDYYVAGLEWVESKGADLATSSLGYSDWIKKGEKDGKTAKVSIATNTAFENGMICLTSAGNSGPGAKTLSVPADGINVISVGATSVSGKIANFSSRGPTDDGRMKPEIVAPGEQVWVTSTSGSFRKGNGTSFSAPLAAGGVALLLQMNPKLTPQEMRDLLQKTARAKGTPDNIYGWGEMDIAKAVKDFCDCVDADKDGFKDEACGGKDCDDSDPKIHPEAKEICDDEVDNNCNDKVDQEDNECEEVEESTGNSGDETQGPSSGGSNSEKSPKSPKDSSDSTSDKSDASPNKGKSSSPKQDKDGESSGCSLNSDAAQTWSFALGLALLSLRRRKR